MVKKKNHSATAESQNFPLAMIKSQTFLCQCIQKNKISPMHGKKVGTCFGAESFFFLPLCFWSSKSINKIVFSLLFSLFLNFQSLPAKKNTAKLYKLSAVWFFDSSLIDTFCNMLDVDLSPDTSKNYVRTIILFFSVELFFQLKYSKHYEAILKFQMDNKQIFLSSFFYQSLIMY